jgi:hypothetical protein
MYSQDPTGFIAQRTAEAATKYIALRRARDRSIAGRRALAEAEGELAGRLKDGRFIADDGVELTARSGGRVRVRQVNTEPREPGRRAIRRAERLGYEGSPEELRSRGREIRSILRSLTKQDYETLRDRILSDDDDDIDEPAPKSTPRPTPTPTPTPPPAAPPGTFTAEQLRDPAWCVANQAAMAAFAQRNLHVPIAQVG